MKQSILHSLISQMNKTVLLKWFNSAAYLETKQHRTEQQKEQSVFAFHSFYKKKLFD